MKKIKAGLMVGRTELHMISDKSGFSGTSGIREILKKADERKDIKALAVTDINSVQATGEHMFFSPGCDIKLICGMIVTACRMEEKTECVLISRNMTGRKNLFRIVTEAYKKGSGQKPEAEWEYILDHRQGLLIGASCDGEVTGAVCEGESDEIIRKMMKKYDYVEIQPRENMSCFCDVPKAETVISRTVELAGKAGKPVIAVSNAAFTDPEDGICHELLTSIDPEGKVDKRPRYLRGMLEMLREFSFLGKDKAKEVVLTNPDRIAARCGEYEVFPDNGHSLHFSNENEKLKKICREAVILKYGEDLPEMIRKRLKLELKSICINGYAGVYLFAKLLTDRSHDLGYLTGSRGSVGASFVAYLCGITDINPLPAHYCCPKCHRFELFSERPEDYHYIGYDLPKKLCPKCQTEMERDGFNIPYEVFASVNYDREPDIDLNIAGEIKDDLIDHVKDIFGEENVIRAGKISTLSWEKVYQKLHEFAKKNGKDPDEVFKKIGGIKTGMEVHPGGIIVLPRGRDINDITPVQYARDGDRDVKITHLEWQCIDRSISKFDIIPHNMTGLLHELEVRTGVKEEEIPYDDEKVLSFFRNADLPGPAERRNALLSEFDTLYEWRVASKTGVNSFSDIIRIIGMVHGTGCWTDNAEVLVSEGKEVKDIISCRDDVLQYLESIGVDHFVAFKIMESVRKGQLSSGIRKEHIAIMKSAGAPEWYIRSCKKIRYLFPKAHTISYAKQIWKLAYYCIYYPEAFDD